MSKFRYVSILGWITIGAPTLLFLIMLVTAILANINREPKQTPNVINKQEERVEPVKLEVKPEVKPVVIEKRVIDTPKPVIPVKKQEPVIIEVIEEQVDSVEIDTLIINQVDTYINQYE